MKKTKLCMLVLSGLLFGCTSSDKKEPEIVEETKDFKLGFNTSVVDSLVKFTEVNEDSSVSAASSKVSKVSVMSSSSQSSNEEDGNTIILAEIEDGLVNPLNHFEMKDAIVGDTHIVFSLQFNDSVGIEYTFLDDTGQEATGNIDIWTYTDTMGCQIFKVAKTGGDVECFQDGASLNGINLPLLGVYHDGYYFLNKSVSGSEVALHRTTLEGESTQISEAGLIIRNLSVQNDYLMASEGTGLEGWTIATNVTAEDANDIEVFKVDSDEEAFPHVTNEGVMINDVARTGVTYDFDNSGFTFDQDTYEIVQDLYDNSLYLVSEENGLSDSRMVGFEQQLNVEIYESDKLSKYQNMLIVSDLECEGSRCNVSTQVLDLINDVAETVCENEAASDAKIKTLVDGSLIVHSYKDSIGETIACAVDKESGEVNEEYVYDSFVKAKLGVNEVVYEQYEHTSEQMQASYKVTQHIENEEYVKIFVTIKADASIDLSNVEEYMTFEPHQQYEIEGTGGVYTDPEYVNGFKFGDSYTAYFKYYGNIQHGFDILGAINVDRTQLKDIDGEEIEFDGEAVIDILN